MEVAMTVAVAGTSARPAVSALAGAALASVARKGAPLGFLSLGRPRS